VPEHSLTVAEEVKPLQHNLYKLKAEEVKMKGLGVVLGVVLLLACAFAVTQVEELWQTYTAKLETDRLLAQAKADEAAAAEADAEAALAVARGEQAILKQAALSIAADRNLVTLYAVSGNVSILAGVLLAGLVIGFWTGKRRDKEAHHV